MPIYAVSITKRVSFRGANQEFSNVYHYDYSGALGQADADALIDAIKAIEVPLHSSDVTFVLGRVWTAGGSPAANQMVAEKALSGTGSQAVIGEMDRERAVLAQWPAGLNVLGRPVYLRKWFHSCGNCNAVSFSAAIFQNTAAISDANRNTIQAKVNELRQVTANAKTFNLCAKSGRLSTAPAVIYKWLEHHQLGDQWRG